MMAGMSTAILSLLVMAQMARARLFGVYPGNYLEPLCNNEPTKLKLRSDLDTLVNMAPPLVAKGKCSQHIYDALRSLKALLGYENEHVCTMKKALNIKAFYHEYLDTSDKKVAQTREKLPESLRHFALAYGMQVSNLCKKNLAEAIMNYAEKDHSEQELFIEQGDVLEFLGSVSEPGDFFPPHYFTKEISQKLIIRKYNSSPVTRFRSLCEGSFRPIYKSLVMPLTVLSSVGLNYKDEHLKKALRHKQVAKQMNYWLMVTLVCELMDKNVVVKKGSKKDDLVMLTEEEAKEPKEVNSDSQAAANSASNEYAAGVELDEPLPAFNVTIPNLVYNKDDFELVSMVEEFKTSRNESERIRKRLLKHSSHFLRGEKFQKPLTIRINEKLAGLIGIHRNGASTTTSEVKGDLKNMNRQVQKPSLKKRIC